MSADRAAAAAPAQAPGVGVFALRVLRYAIGATLAMTVAMALDWQLAFLTPVLALGFLASPAPPPSLQSGAAFVLTIAVACLGGLLLSRYLLAYPLVYLPVAGLLLFHLFHAAAAGRSPIVVTWLLIALLVIPMLALQDSGLANLVARGIVFGAVVTMLLVQIIYRVVPDPIETAHVTPAQASTQAKPALPPGELFTAALVPTVVVFPVLVLFYTLQWSGAMLILVFIGLLSSQPGFAKNYKAGAALILGNVIGGGASIVFYELLVLVPEFGFLILLTLLSGLLFGTRVFSGKPTAPLYGMAFSTVLLVIGSTTSSSGDAGAKVYSRVIQIMCAVVYVVVAFGTIERFRQKRKS